MFPVVSYFSWKVSILLSFSMDQHKVESRFEVEANETLFLKL